MNIVIALQILNFHSIHLPYLIWSSIVAGKVFAMIAYNVHVALFEIKAYHDRISISYITQ